MIPQALKWVGAALVLLILVVVAAPLAVDAIFDTVEFDDESGLFETADDADPLEGLEAEPDAVEELEEQADAEEETEADDEDPEAGTEDSVDDAEVVTGDDDADGDDGDDEGSGAETYVVEGGDTLYSIAEEVYGDGSRWTEIAEANGIGDRSALTVGQELDIP